MAAKHLAGLAKDYLQHLCLELPSRRVGSQGNQKAADFFEQVLASHGFETAAYPFDCIDWVQDEVRLAAGGIPYQAFASPYSLGCQVRAPLVVCSTLEELKVVEAANSILLLRGEIVKEQLMPKNFPFYNPEEHGQIYRLVEEKCPLAVITATARNPEAAGALYPFPLFDDGDFDLPSIYLAEEEGVRLAGLSGEEVDLTIQARRIPSQGSNITGRKGADPARRIALLAHIDAKPGSPGATDNAAGIVTLLLLAELLADYSGRLTIEITAINGEDYYANPGEQVYLRQNMGRFEEIVLGINLDGVGFHQGRTAYSLYEPPPEMAALIREVFSGRPGLIEGEPWYQGDHFLFLMNGVPALAVTSENVLEIMTHYAHSDQDRPDIVDPERLAALALALRELLLRLDGIA
jgi:aminopeptidase YwaD